MRGTVLGFFIPDQDEKASAARLDMPAAALVVEALLDVGDDEDV